MVSIYSLGIWDGIFQYRSNLIYFLPKINILMSSSSHILYHIKLSIQNQLINILNIIKQGDL
jgi:hypothetical protein